MPIEGQPNFPEQQLPQGTGPAAPTFDFSSIPDGYQIIRGPGGYDILIPTFLRMHLEGKLDVDRAASGGPDPDLEGRGQTNGRASSIADSLVALPTATEVATAQRLILSAQERWGMSYADASRHLYHLDAQADEGNVVHRTLWKYVGTKIGTFLANDAYPPLSDIDNGYYDNRDLPHGGRREYNRAMADMRLRAAELGQAPDVD